MYAYNWKKLVVSKYLTQTVLSPIIQEQ